MGTPRGEKNSRGKGKKDGAKVTGWHCSLAGYCSVTVVLFPNRWDCSQDPLLTDE